MSFKRIVNEMVKQRLPATGNRRDQAIDQTGSHKRPQIEQIVDCLENGAREGPGPRSQVHQNSPLHDSAGFFEMQEEEQRACDELKRKQEAKQIAGE